MFVRKLDRDEFTREYGVESKRLYPWEDVAVPPFGAMWSIVEPGKRSTRHNHHEAETFVIVEGSGVITVDEEQRAVESGDVVYLPPFSTHTLENTAQSGALRFLAVYWEDLAQLEESEERERAARAAAARPTLLVTATPPTVNGDLHLGHLSGPYLAADIFTRFERMRGRDVLYVSGGDDHQSYVVNAALQRGESPRATADHFSDAIERTLAAADVGLDHFARPSTSPYHTEMVQALFRRLYEGGELVRRSAPTLFCEGCALWLFEAHVSGTCPHCGEGSDGNACEACGRPNDCVDLVEPRCKHCDAAPVVRPLERLYFPLAGYADRLRDFHGRVHMAPHVAALCEEMLRDGLPDVPVSHPADWGIPVPVEGFEDQRIYVWFEMGPGYLAATRGGAPAATGEPGWERFWKSDGAEIVQFFGFDNAWFHAILFPATWMAFDPGLRLPTAFVTNEFYLLDGAKFSTSRRHAVWAREFVEEESADCARFHVTLDRPEGRQTNFTREGFETAVREELVETWLPWLDDLARAIGEEFGGAAPVTGGYSARQRVFLRRLRACVTDVEDCLDARSFSSAGALRSICAMVRDAAEFARGEAYLRGVAERRDDRRTSVALELLAARTLAMVTAPILPEFSARLWSALGFDERVAGRRWEHVPEFVPGGQRVTRIAAGVFGGRAGER